MDPSRGPKRARANDYPSGAHPGATYGHADYNDYSGYSEYNPQGHENKNAQLHGQAPPAPTHTSPAPTYQQPQKVQHSPQLEEFSAVVKSKVQSYTRTGQACDRCKVRKIRCDALPEGCSHCLGQNLQCFVTDRITGRTERRGYLQDLERENTAMASHIEHLEKLLRDQAGTEVLPWKWSPFKLTCPPGVTLDDEGNAVGEDGDDIPWERSGTVWWKPGPGGSKPGFEPSQPAPGDADTPAQVKAPSSDSILMLPASDKDLQSWPIDNYLGVFADRAPLNSVNGTTVSILGTLLDIDANGADVEPEPSTVYHEPTGLYNRSMSSFLRSTMNINPPIHIDLPSRSDAFEYSEWFFLMIHPFVPILHKPSYMALLTNIYDSRDFTPSISQLTTIHMVFAIIYFQYGVRNRDQVDRHIHLHDLSNKHYHWALSKFYHIYSDQSVTAVQALVLITLYTRAFPKPGCGSSVASCAVMKAIDLGLHRKSDIPESQTTLSNEMRKRAWWLSLMLSVTLNGRLGRPMPIRAEDFDIEMPMAISDEYLTEDGITDLSMIGKASFMVALHAIKFTTLYMDVNSYLYGARRDPRRYGAIVRQLETQYNEIQDNLPPELNVEGCKPAYLMYALYAHAVSLEFMLCLHHPSACMTSDPQVFAENTRICEETARKLLRHVQKLLELKSLDTTWYQMSVYCAAMFSTLAAAWERRHKATASDIEQLQDETSIWLSIIAEMNMLAGASDNGQPFNSKLTQICARTIFGILRDMPPAARKAVMANNALLTPNISGTNRKAALSAARRVISNGANNPHSSGSSDDRAVNAATGSISSADGSHSGIGTPSSRYSPGNVDSVALHLETQARMMFDSRREPAQAVPDVPVAAPSVSGADDGMQLSPVQHHSSSRYSVGEASYSQNITNVATVSNVQNVPAMPMQQAYTHQPHHMDISADLNGYTHNPQQHQQQHQQHQQAIFGQSHHTHPVVPPNSAVAAAATTADMAAAAAAVVAANPWTNWTSSISDTQSHDQFNSANALLDLSMLHHRLAPGLSTGRPVGSGLEQPPNNGGADAATAAAVLQMVNRGGDVPAQQNNGGMQTQQQTDVDPHAGQWPLILFSDNNNGV